MGAFRKFGVGLGWGAETLSDWFKKQTPCKMAVIGTNQWFSMEKVRLFNAAPLFSVTPADNTLDYFVKQLVLLGFPFFNFYVYLCMFHKTAKICSKSYKN